MSYQPALDGIRALAVSAVVLFHMHGGALPGAWIGVDIFFVLSGYLITGTLLREHRLHGRISLRRFYMRRCLRLLPAFWCLLAFVAATAPFDDHSDQLLLSVLASMTYFINWARAFQLVPQTLVGHTWSLAVEEQFYLVWPLALLFIMRRRPARWIVATLALVVLWRCTLLYADASIHRLYNAFDTRADALLLGCLLAILPAAATLAVGAARSCVIPLIVLGYIAMHWSLWGAFVPSIGFLIVALLACWLILACQVEGWPRRLLSAAPLVLTGRISYGIYLWHYPLMLLGEKWFGLAGVVAAVPLSYLVALLSFSTVERWFLSLRHTTRNLDDFVSPMIAASR